MSSVHPTPTPNPVMHAHPREPHPWIHRVVAGRYALRAVIGEGGMGTVFRAHQLGVGRDVAVKILRPSMADNDPHVTELFFREARAASRLSHPHIVTVYDFGRTDDGLLYIAMELLEGQSLTALAMSGELSLVDKLRISVQICRALGEAHAEGVVHRDVKPDNVLVVPRRWDPHVVKMLDFGLVKVVGSGFETGQTGMRFGTPLYMSPEQILGRSLDHRADIYALGVLLFELFSGRPPFTGRTPLRVCMQHVEEDPPRMGEHLSRLAIPAELDSLVHRMLAKEPTDRPQDVEEVRLSLRTILEWERSMSPTTQTRRPAAEGDADGEPIRLDANAEAALRQSQPVEFSRDQSSADSRWAVADQPVPRSEDRTAPTPIQVYAADPQASITQLIPELSRKRPPTGRLLGSLTPRARVSAPAAGFRIVRDLDVEGGSRSVTRPIRSDLSVEAAHAQPVRAASTLRLGEDRPNAPTAGPSMMPEVSAPAVSAPAVAAPAVSAPAVAAVVRIPRTGTLSPRRHPARRTWPDTAEYAARALLAALLGAAAGWAGFWMLTRLF